MRARSSFVTLRRGVAACVVAASCAIPAVARAQGALSILGFGYPIAGLSARALATGGSLAGLDAQSPLNPAAIVLNSRAQAYGQYEPEMRTVTAGNVTTKTTTSRFPLFSISGRQGQATFSASFGAFMDRSWSNTYPDTQVFGGERLPSTVVTQSQGGIAEARGAMAWSFTDRFHAGIGLHVFPGKNSVSVAREFPDSAHAGTFQVSNSYAFSGTAVSLGTVWIPGGHFVLAGDMRLGGTLRMRLGDSTIVGEGKVPFRYGLSAAYDGIPGAVLIAHVGGDKWTDLRGLGSATLGLKDGTDVSLGAEVAGPRVSEVSSMLRLGWRSRGLPFTYAGSGVTETAMTGGVGIPIIGGRTMVDVGVARVNRSGAGAIREKAWLVSIGVGIRP